MQRQRPQRGINLIELMIVVAVIGIMAAIAMPNYQRYVQRVQCEDVRSDLLELSQWLERYRVINNSYDIGDDSLPITSSPRDGTAVYNIELIEAGTGDTTFLLRAERPDFDPITGGGVGHCDRVELTHLGRFTIVP